MKRVYRITPILILFLLALPTISLAGQFKVTRIYDGDTIKAEGHDIEIKVRLVGIDTPETSKKKRELGQPYSQRAKKHLAGLILNKVVEIKGYGLGPFNRILGVIYLNGKNINLEMIRTGLAEVYRGKPPKGFDSTPYLQAETEAKESKRGIWSLGEKYISPGEWRKMQRRR